MVAKSIAKKLLFIHNQQTITAVTSLLVNQNQMPELFADRRRTSVDCKT